MGDVALRRELHTLPVSVCLSRASATKVLYVLGLALFPFPGGRLLLYLAVAIVMRRAFDLATESRLHRRVGLLSHLDWCATK